MNFIFININIFIGGRKEEMCGSVQDSVIQGEGFQGIYEPNPVPLVKAESHSAPLG